MEHTTRAHRQISLRHRIKAFRLFAQGVEIKLEGRDRKAHPQLRAHRIGQQRPVTVYRLVTQGSIEEKIVRLHRSKRDLAEGILSGEDAGAPIDAAQLMELLKAQ